MEQSSDQVEEKLLDRRSNVMETPIEEQEFPPEVLQRPPEHLPTDMSDTTESEAEKLPGSCMFSFYLFIYIHICLHGSCLKSKC